MTQRPVLQAGDLQILDGLRGLAAIYVVLYHARGILWVGWTNFAGNLGAHAWPDVLLAAGSFAFRFGQEAVLLFFVLSGFVIHYRQATQQAAGLPLQFDGRSYWRRRLLRLYPPLLFAMLLTLLLDTWGAQINPGFYSGTDRPAAITTLAGLGDHSPLTFVGNLLFLQGPLVNTFGSNNPLWSLSYEFYFYLLYPCCLVLYRRWGSGRVFGGLALLGLLSVGAVQALGLWPWAIFIYFAVWWAGAFCADLYARKQRVGHPHLLLLAGLGAMGLGALFGDRLPHRLDILLWGGGIACLFGFLLLPARLSTLRRLLQQFCLRAMPSATFSYTLYLTHFPLIVFVAAFYLRSHAGLPAGLGLAFAAAGGCILFSALVARFVERPFLTAHPHRAVPGRELPVDPTPQPAEKPS